MSNEYKMSLRDWLSQIQVRLTGLMLALFFLPILVGLAWEHWAGQGLIQGWQTRILVQVLIGGVMLGTGIWAIRGISRRLTAVGLAADAFATRGDLTQTLPDKGRDELAWTAYSFNQMMKRLNKIADAFDQIADGDLTVEIQVKSDEDRLAQALNAMTTNLRQMVGQVADSASSLGAASSQLASAAEQAGQATSQIATTIQQVAKGSTQQTQAVTQTAAAVEQMSRAIDGVARGAQEQANAVAKASALTAQISQAIEQVAHSAQSGAEASVQAATTAQAGARTVEQTIQGMATIKAKVGLSAEKVQEMGRRSQQIGAIVETIDDIASQTNLLALNAAIEAARAGEHGKGFAVVADEVRKLAERASAATKEIGELIRSIQHTVAEAVAAMEEGAREVEMGVSRAGEAGQALAEIRRVVEAVNQQVGAIAAAAQHMAASSNELVVAMDAVSAVVEENTAATEEMAAGSGEVTQAIEHIASVSQENSAAVEEVSAAAEEMSAQVEEVTASAQALSEMAQSLQELVARFRLSAEGAQAPSGAKLQGRKAAPAPRPAAAVPVSAGVGNGHAYREVQVGRRG